jgi:hypothetical protein
METYEEFVFDLKEAMEEVVHLSPTQAARLFFTFAFSFVLCAPPKARFH